MKVKAFAGGVPLWETSDLSCGKGGNWRNRAKAIDGGKLYCMTRYADYIVA